MGAKEGVLSSPYEKTFLFAYEHILRALSSYATDIEEKNVALSHLLFFKIIVNLVELETILFFN